jgi:hypothetical protein
MELTNQLRDMLTERGRISGAPQLGTAIERLAGYVAGPDRLPGSVSGDLDPAVGQ